MDGTIMRYALFAGQSYYPTGGWEDHVGSSDDVEELRIMATAGLVATLPGQTPTWDWAHIVDLTTGEQVTWWCCSKKWSDQ